MENSFDGDLAEYVEMMIGRHARLSHRQASVEAGLANNSVTQIVNRSVIKPRPDTLRKLAEKWGDEEDYSQMMILAGYTSGDEGQPKEEMSALEAERVISALRKMTPEQREMAIRYILERSRGQSSE